jgi:hypothetical protein
MSASLLVHDAIVRDAIESHEGYVFATGAAPRGLGRIRRTGLPAGGG